MSIPRPPERQPSVHQAQRAAKRRLDHVPQLLIHHRDGPRWRRIGGPPDRRRAPLPDRPSTRADPVQHRGDRIMTTVQTEAPRVVSRAEWLSARKALLQREKELTYLREEVAQARRQLPRVRVDKTYTFAGKDGPVTLADLFESRSQLLVYHFMFHPDWVEGCPS